MYRLIIVDDDSYILKLFVSLFDWESMGFSVSASFSSSTECLAWLRTNTVDAIITDIKMPNLSGLELSKICAKEFPDVGIVITSAYTNFEYAHEAIKYNVIGYLLKPIDENDLTQTMERLKVYLDKLNKKDDVKEPETPIVQKIKAYVSQNYSKNISSTELAKHLMISNDYFFPYFKKHTGQTFSQYLCHYRMEKACDLLQNTDLKIPTIMEQVGYKSQTHFYESFQKIYSQTPSEYRRNHQK